MQEPWRELPRGFYHLADGAGEDEAYVQFHGRPPIPLSQELLGTLNHQVADVPALHHEGHGRWYSHLSPW